MATLVKINGELNGFNILDPNAKKEIVEFFDYLADIGKEVFIIEEL
jgi:hypothetical protein